MKILALSSTFKHPAVTAVKFGSEDSALDYDMLVWAPNNVIDEYKSSSKKYRGCPSLDSDDSVAILRDGGRRKSEMLEMLKLGRTVVIFTPKPSVFYVDTGERRYSGTGRNRQTTIVVKDISLLSLLPIDIQTVDANGKSISFVGGIKYSHFWNSNKDHLVYKAYFQNPNGNPIFTISNTDKVVGMHFQIHNGHLLFLPDFYTTQKMYSAITKNIIDSIIVMVEELKKDSGDFSIPSWAQFYKLPAEDQYKNELSLLETNLSELLLEINRKKEEIIRLEEYKLLFSGTGKALEVQVRRIFLELGFEVSEGAPGRDDLIIKHNDQVAVVEIKGVNKSAAEKHAAQLEKWVSEYYANNGIRPKGILVVNAFKDIPLSDRNEPAFPHQMIKYSLNREHCLITGLQLLGLYLDFKNNPGRLQNLTETLLTTEGIFPLYQAWPEYMTNHNDNGTIDTKEE
ncbi:MAG: hypothetical protein U0175_17390 [Caldilineaceae bacterium]